MGFEACSKHPVQIEAAPEEQGRNQGRNQAQLLPKTSICTCKSETPFNMTPWRSTSIPGTAPVPDIGMAANARRAYLPRLKSKEIGEVENQLRLKERRKPYPSLLKRLKHLTALLRFYENLGWFRLAATMPPSKIVFCAQVWTQVIFWEQDGAAGAQPLSAVQQSRSNYCLSRIG